MLTEARKEYYRKRSRRMRLTVLGHYGGKCACCGESRTEFLSVDHSAGGGRVHRRQVLYPNTGSRVYYEWLIKSRFPEGIRILCHNCNMARGFNGYCPHEQDPRIAH